MDITPQGSATITSEGLVIPLELVEKLGMNEGDEVVFVKPPHADHDGFIVHTAEVFEHHKQHMLQHAHGHNHGDHSGQPHAH